MTLMNYRRFEMKSLNRATSAFASFTFAGTATAARRTTATFWFLLIDVFGSTIAVASHVLNTIGTALIYQILDAIQKTQEHNYPTESTTHTSYHFLLFSSTNFPPPAR